ncbi:HNH endonuclease, partial [Streptomyces sp. NPDC020875]
MTRAAMVAALTLTALLSPVHAAGAVPATGAQAETAPAAAQTVRIGEAVNRLPVRTEDRTGYERSKFKHWNSGLKPDGCNTRNEVLVSEAVTAPTIGARCALTGGSWYSYYDAKTVTPASALDIDHMVPLA